MITRSDIKVTARYAVIVYVCYLAHYILQDTFIRDIKGLGDIGIGAIYTSIFGTLAYLAKSNWSTPVPNEKNI